jgi:hypothetical protein
VCEGSQLGVGGFLLKRRDARPDKALDQLEPLLKLPYQLTPAWLRIDPAFEPLRSNPRFQRLAAGTQ